MTEQIRAARVDRVLRLDGFDEEVEERWSVRRDLPSAPIARIGTGDDEALALGEIAPGIDERTAVAAGSVERDEQRRRRRVDRLRDEEVIRPLVAIDRHRLSCR